MRPSKVTHGWESEPRLSQCPIAEDPAVTSFCQPQVLIRRPPDGGHGPNLQSRTPTRHYMPTFSLLFNELFDKSLVCRFSCGWLHIRVWSAAVVSSLSACHWDATPPPPGSTSVITTYYRRPHSPPQGSRGKIRFLGIIMIYLSYGVSLPGSLPIMVTIF